MYHKFGVSKYPTTSVTIEQFESHLEEFKKPKYSVLPLEFIMDSISSDTTLPENVISFTVDDADRSFLEVAWPRLKALNFSVVLFINTNLVSQNNKNYLNWNEIRQLINEGVTIGSHSHTHNHLNTYNLTELKEEIETSNRIFLKELGKIPSLFAFPYGETNLDLMNMLEDYNFKAAFGQHSGVINETSNKYYLPRFSINEKYGEIERMKFISNTKGLGIYDFIPNDPVIVDNPPYIGFSLLDQSLSNKLQCFVYDSKGQVDSDLYIFNERIEIRLNRKMNKGRSRLNCTAKTPDNNWRWFGYQFLVNE